MTTQTASPIERLLAPAPSKNGSVDDSSQTPQQMPFTCQTCSRRKVKCDKVVPICSTCKKAKLECAYQAPPPRRRKRKHSEDLHDKLSRYESMLHEHGLLKNENAAATIQDDPKPDTAVNLHLNEPETAMVGRLVSQGSGKSRYINSNLWRVIGEEDTQLSDDEDDTQENGTDDNADPLTAALLGRHHSITELHPPYTAIKQLWSTYVTHVDPICRVLHAPSMESIIDEAARNPEAISKPLEALMFAIYHFSTISMSQDECLTVLGETQKTVQKRYRQATCQALVNAGLLRSSEMQVLQAFVLFLLSVRTHYDPHTFWILSGVAFRMGQRLGIHRDGEMLGLPPFEVQMRRRLFWQVLPMDGIAAQISGTGIAPAASSWDTKPPLNLDENQIWPGMTQQPEEQVGATDMIFIIARTEVGRFHNRTKTALRAPDSESCPPQEKHQLEALDLEKRIDEMEDQLERRIVRYCDVVEPLHFLTISMCRGAMTVMRLRVKISLSRHLPMSSENMREVWRLAMKVVDYDIAAHGNPSLTKYMWHFRALFQHSALACVLTSLRNPIFLSQQEIRSAWEKIGKLFSNHPELMEQKGALQIAMARLTLRSWDASASNAGIIVEPGFITTLRSLRTTDKLKRQPHNGNAHLITPTETSLSNDTSPEGQGILNGLSTDDFNVNYDFSLDNMDWMHWDRLMQDFQANNMQSMAPMS